MLRICKACNECSFCFLASLIKILVVKAVFASYYMKLGLPMLLRCFLILPNFSLMSLIVMFLIKKCAIEPRFFLTSLDKFLLSGMVFLIPACKFLKYSPCFACIYSVFSTRSLDDS